jgi:hypothetical protein
MQWFLCKWSGRIKLVNIDFLLSDIVGREDLWGIGDGRVCCNSANEHENEQDEKLKTMMHIVAEYEICVVVVRICKTIPNFFKSWLGLPGTQEKKFLGSR